MSKASEIARPAPWYERSITAGALRRELPCSFQADGPAADDRGSGDDFFVAIQRPAAHSGILPREIRNETTSVFTASLSSSPPWRLSRIWSRTAWRRRVCPQALASSY